MLVPDSGGSYDPKDVAAEVAGVIRLQPERWNQAAWFDPAPGLRTSDENYYSMMAVGEITASLDGETACGSTACVAGWAAILTAPQGWFISDNSYLFPPASAGVEIAAAGRRALGLCLTDASWLFHSDRSREQVLAALDSLAKGEEMVQLEDEDA